MSKDIYRTLRLFHPPGNVVEIRVLGVPERELVSHAVRYFVSFRHRNSSREFWELPRRGSGMGLEEPERIRPRTLIAL